MDAMNASQYALMSITLNSVNHKEKPLSETIKLRLLFKNQRLVKHTLIYTTDIMPLNIVKMIGLIAISLHENIVKTLLKVLMILVKKFSILKTINSSVLI